MKLKEVLGSWLVALVVGQDDEELRRATCVWPMGGQVGTRRPLAMRVNPGGAGWLPMEGGGAEDINYAGTRSDASASYCFKILTADPDGGFPFSQPSTVRAETPTSSAMRSREICIFSRSFRIRAGVTSEDLEDFIDPSNIIYAFCVGV